MNSLGSLQWAYDKAVAAGGTADAIKAAVAEALALEAETLGAWGAWYEEAVVSPHQLLGDDVSRDYQLREDHAVRDVGRITGRAVANANAIAANLVAGL